MPAARELLAGILVLALPLAACHDDRTSQAPMPSPSAVAAPPSGDLCVRAAPRLAEKFRPTLQPGTYRAVTTVPSYDWCQLSYNAVHRLAVGITSLPSSKRDLDAARRAWDTRRSPEDPPARPLSVSDGAFGVDDLSRPYLVFLTHSRLVRIVHEGGGSQPNELDFLADIARTVDDVIEPLPSRPVKVTLPACGRGTAAAERILGAAALVRRDRLVDGRYLVCEWATRTRTVVVSSGGPGSVEKEIFDGYLGSSLPYHAVPDDRVDIGNRVGLYAVGAGVVFQAASRAFIRVFSQPNQHVKEADLVALARVMASAYRG